MSLMGKDIDMDRTQGEVGLFVPEAGYLFGVIPHWESDRVEAMRPSEQK